MSIPSSQVLCLRENNPDTFLSVDLPWKSSIVFTICCGTHKRESKKKSFIAIFVGYESMKAHKNSLNQCVISWHAQVSQENYTRFNFQNWDPIKLKQTEVKCDGIVSVTPSIASQLGNNRRRECSGGYHSWKKTNFCLFPLVLKEIYKSATKLFCQFIFKGVNPKEKGFRTSRGKFFFCFRLNNYCQDRGFLLCKTHFQEHVMSQNAQITT